MHKKIFSETHDLPLAKTTKTEIDEHRPKRTPKILFFVGVDWFFYSHFLDRAIAARKAGYDVVVMTHVTGSGNEVAKAHGIEVIDIAFERGSLNPIGLIRSLLDVRRILKQEQPDIVHQIALKPIVVGSIACRIIGVKRVVNAVVGLGYAFSSNHLSAKLVRALLWLVLRFVPDKENAMTVFENSDDRDFFISNRWVKRERTQLIRGAGVDIDRFRPRDQVTQPPKVMLLSRMLWDKGIAEFVEAARQLQQKHGRDYAQFVLVGDSDDQNRGAIPRSQLTQWQSEGVIDWWGFRADVQNVLAQATISCLPSYREGLPKSLLESLAMGLPCIATDVPGCREAVKDGINGYLVAAQDPGALADAIERLLHSADRRAEFGRASRAMALEEFSNEIVNRDTLALYAKLMRQTA